MHVHRCRFADWMPEPIHTLAALPAAYGGHLVAVGREGGDIELVSPSEKWSVVARVAGDASHGEHEIRGLAWVNNRLFAVSACTLCLFGG